MSLWGLDVSKAFLYATLDEPQAVVLPASRVGNNGERLFLKLKMPKASAHFHPSTQIPPMG